MPKFELGRTVATPAALEVIEAAGQEASFFLNKHAAGDFGEADPVDVKANDDAIRTGERVLSIYRTLLGVELWVLTEAADDAVVRAATTVLLPDEY